MKTPKVELFNYTPNALETLVFTKSGRLKPGTSFQDIMNMSEEEKLDHMSYMLDTIKSAFEFTHYYFKIDNVSRAFTHQFVRTTANRYQEQSQRTVNAKDSGVTITSDHPAFNRSIEASFEAYEEMIKDGEQVQNARGVLPTNIHSEILATISLKSLSDMASLRLCKRTQKEYQDIFKAMIEEVLKIHPWAKPLLEVYCVKNATCAFPRYTECPVQEFCIDPADYRDNIRKAWEESDHAANPVVGSNAMTM